MTAPQIGLKITVLDPTYPEATEITKDDVFGRWTEDHRTKVHDGMVVHRQGEKCSYFGDVVPYKSVTVVCPDALLEQVSYWLEYVHGCDCISRIESLGDGRTAVRSDYMAW